MRRVDKLAVKWARKHKADSEDREIMQKNQKEGRRAKYKKMRVYLNQCMIISSDTGKISQSKLKQHIWFQKQNSRIINNVEPFGPEK